MNAILQKTSEAFWSRVGWCAVAVRFHIRRYALGSKDMILSFFENSQSRIDLFLLPLLIFIPRLLDLDVFLTADEPLFLRHAQEFAAGLASGDFSQTLGIGYPGVTVAWWSAPFVGLDHPMLRLTELEAYTAGRLATALVSGFLLLVLFGLARLLIGRWPALLGVGWLALDPYTLAYSRLLHIATPLALFMTLAGLSFLLWLRKPQPRWLILTGLFTGLALLTKSTALLLGPMLGVSLLGWALATGNLPDRSWWLSRIGGLILTVFIAVGVFFVLWPAMWTDPAQALNLTFGKLFVDQEAGAGNLGFYWLGRFVEDPGPAFYPVAFLLKSTPWLLIGLLLSLWFVASTLRQSLVSRNTNHASRNHVLPITLTLWLFAITYLLLMTIASKKSIRYMLPAFPTFYLLAGLAFYQTWSILSQRHNPVSNFDLLAPAPPALPVRASPGAVRQGWVMRAGASVSPRLLGVLLFLPFAFFAWFYHPYYFTYYNPLLLGWRWAPHTLLVGWGEGLDGAARFLNQEPAGTVSAWYEWLFLIFYQGQVEAVVPPDNLITADHTVLYINQVQRDIPNPNVIHYFKTRRQPEYTVRLAGIDYAWVYPGPIAGFRPDPSPQYRFGGDFGGQARLLGYDLRPQPRSGQPLIVTLYWRVLAEAATDNFVYLRLTDTQGRIWARSDSPPVMGLWPTTRWQPDMLIEDAHELPVPVGTPPGTYRLEVGLFDPATGQTLPASGRPVGQGGGLILGEVPVEWQPVKAKADLPNQTNVRLAPNARLIGYGMLPAGATTGDLIPLRLAWRESKTVTAFLAVPNNFVMFQWRNPGGSASDPPLTEQLDELPLPIDEWGRRATLLSQHEIIVPPTLAAGRYDLVVMLHTSSDPAGEAFLLGTVAVTSPPHEFNLPSTALTPAGRHQLDQTIALVGYRYQRSDPSIDLQLFWQTETPITVGYKVFAQLLSADNALISQSDSVPAAGQRPTSGWLPDEIITDPHTLTLPSDLSAGTYALIAGLYNPLTGERLPVVGKNGETVADAIFITEVDLALSKK